MRDQESAPFLMDLLSSCDVLLEPLLATVTLQLLERWLILYKHLEPKRGLSGVILVILLVQWEVFSTPLSLWCVFWLMDMKLILICFPFILFCVYGCIIPSYYCSDGFVFFRVAFFIPELLYILLLHSGI